jgi:Kinesin motor domain
VRATPTTVRPTTTSSPLLPRTDHVFTEASTTRELFSAAVKNLVTSVVDGYNGTVFAYGQTAAGKTHTMLGSGGEPGILPLSVNEIMECISRSRHRAFLIRCSYIEIYKEQITDLLGKKVIEVHESKAKVRRAAEHRTTLESPNSPRSLPHAGHLRRRHGGGHHHR